VAVIFDYFQFSVIVFCVVATQKTKSELAFDINSNFDCCNNTESNYNYTKPEVTKITVTFALVDLLTFE
jgi:hypothetical protein